MFEQERIEDDFQEEILDRPPPVTSAMQSSRLSRRRVLTGLVALAAAIGYGVAVKASDDAYQEEQARQADLLPNIILSKGIQDSVIQSAYMSPSSPESVTQIGRVGLINITDIKIVNTVGFAASIQEEAPAFGLTPIKNVDYETTFSLYKATLKNAFGMLTKNVYIESMDAVFGIFRDPQNPDNVQKIPVTGVERRMRILNLDTNDERRPVSLNRSYVGIYTRGSDIFLQDENGNPISPTGFFVTRRATPADFQKAGELYTSPIV